MVFDCDTLILYARRFSIPPDITRRCVFLTETPSLARLGIMDDFRMLSGLNPIAMPLGLGNGFSLTGPWVSKGKVLVTETIGIKYARRLIETQRERMKALSGK